MDYPEAVDAAVQSCIADGILDDYLRARRAEVRDMFMTEYDEEQAHKWFKEEGRQEGRQAALVLSVRNLMESTGWDAEKAMSALGIPGEERAGCLEKLG